MPWEVSGLVQQRYDLVQEMLAGELPVAALCQKYRVSRTCAYKWLGRFLAAGEAGLADRSRRPRHSPTATAEATCEQVRALRERYPRWGSRKLQVLLEGPPTDKPTERTVHRILTRAGLVRPPAPPPATQRFERGAPNELWQLDFKSPLWLCGPQGRRRLQPLSVLDDHSRFALGLMALPNQQLVSLWPALWAIFADYGLPQAILTDNANGLFRSHRDGVTEFTMRLWRLDIEHHHGRPYHPQTQGKVERWHRTIKAHVPTWHHEGLPQLQAALDDFRHLYNHVRPHEALGQGLPRDRYQPSARRRPRQLPPLEHPAGAHLRRVCAKGCVSIRGCRVRVGEGLAGEKVQLLDEDGDLLIKYGRFVVRRLRWDDLRANQWL